jgi:hypothetical protein
MGADFGGEIHMTRRTAAAALLVLATIGTLVAGVPGGPSAGAAASFTVQASINQVAVRDADPGDTAELLAPDDTVLQSRTIDALGSTLFRDGQVDVLDTGLRIPGGPGYRVRISAETSDPVTVLDPDTPPAQSFYDNQSIGAGFGYIETRDGTTLSANVTLPDPGVFGPGPYPVVIEYSGYSPSNPSSPTPVLLPLPIKGYATVAVNMRGTGCSGGAFWYWEPLQAIDGYDVVEAVAAQPWAGNVGMAGISYSGISQLYVASTQPPSLDAITPLSVIADTYRSTLYPGGILNDGFALDWAVDRVEDAAPYALDWVQDQVDGGDMICDANQKIRLQSMDILSELTHVRYWSEREEILAPWSFLDQIEVPTLLTGAWQDEQTGGHFATMLDRFDPDTKRRLLLMNGTHMEGMGPQYLPYVWEWLDFYVAEKKPEIPAVLRLAVPAVYAGLLGKAGQFPPDRFTSYPDYASALAAFEVEPPVWIAWENGAGDVDPGFPVPTAITKHSTWPLPEQTAMTMWLGPDGTLTDQPSTLDADEPRGVSQYIYDPSTKPDTNYCCGSDAIWKMQPPYNWQPLADGYGLSFVSEPIAELTAFAGTGSVDLWLRSDVADVDLEVNITEVRPDGQETYIQSGWLRGRQRKLDLARATALEPWHAHLEGDAEPVPQDEFVSARVELLPFAHAVRPGSRLRLTIEAPGGNRPLWESDAEQYAFEVTNDIAHSAVYPSALVLPLIGDPPVPDALPPCPYSMRNQPCRDFVAPRVASDVAAAGDGASLLVTWDPPPTDDPVVFYIVTVLPTGETFTVDGDVTELTYAPDDPFAEVAFSVAAVFDDGTGPESSASVLASADTPAEPATTTTISPTTTTPAAPTSGAGDVNRSAAALGSGRGQDGSLPATGSDLAGLMLVALALLAGGTAAWRASRRRAPRSH